MGAPQLCSFRYALERRNREKSLLYSSLKDTHCSHDDDYDNDDDDDGRCCYGCRRSLRRFGERIGSLWEKLKSALVKGWEFGRSDPRKIVFAAKMGLALTLISLLIFLDTPLRNLSNYYVWAILTVVVVFEFSIGSTLSKGFNRALGTFSAGGLALASARFCIMTGEWEEVFIIMFIFLAAFSATFIKFHPRMKPYEYGFRVFLLTFCIVMVSGYRTRQFIETAVNRFVLIALGAAVGLGVNICIYPIWAGEDLHNLVAKNFMGVADSLEGITESEPPKYATCTSLLTEFVDGVSACVVNGYLEGVEYETVPSKILTYQAYDDHLYSGYRSAVESAAQEETLLGFATWEPPHGHYKMMKYPWKNFVKVGGALRHCSFTVMALHGCILSEIQAPHEKRRVFSSELQRVGIEGAKVLRHLGEKVRTLTKLDPGDILLEVHGAVEELQKKIDRRSYLLVNAESWEIGGKRQCTIDSTDGINIMESRDERLGTKSHSETLLDFRSVQVFPKSWDVLSSQNQQQGSTALAFKPQISRPVQEECKTYESASALSLATFASLLIEFVARLQNVVNEFEELSDLAKFKEAVEEPVVEDQAGLMTRISKLLRFKEILKREEIV